VRRSRLSWARATYTALGPAAAFSVHQLRYLLASGAGASRELARTGHSYLHSAAPWIVLAAALALGVFLRRLGRAFAGRTSPAGYSLSFAGLWLACVASLVAVFALQELIEGFLAAGHAAGLVGVFAYGGWWSIPASACVGLVLAAVLHGARWVLDTIARRDTRSNAERRGIAAIVPAELRISLPVAEPLLGGWSDRGPPA
jgi:hypothetical protein